LQKIKKNKWVSFINTSFSSNGKAIDGKVSEYIADIMKCHSWYVQQLSHYVWNLTHRKATKVELNAALKELNVNDFIDSMIGK
jgi:hypothetical protein